MLVYVCVCMMYVGMSADSYVCVKECMYVCMSTRLYICMHVRMHVCMHVFVEDAVIFVFGVVTVYALHSCVYVHIREYIKICTHTDTRTHAHASLAFMYFKIYICRCDLFWRRRSADQYFFGLDLLSAPTKLIVRAIRHVPDRTQDTIHDEPALF